MGVFGVSASSAVPVVGDVVTTDKGVLLDAASTIVSKNLAKHMKSCSTSIFFIMPNPDELIINRGILNDSKRTRGFWYKVTVKTYILGAEPQTCSWKHLNVLMHLVPSPLLSWGSFSLSQ